MKVLRMESDMIGIDLVKIDRFKKSKDSLIKKIFSEKEIREAKLGIFYKKLAGKWAVKEAAYKAGIKNKIEVLNVNEKPCIFINQKIYNAQISLSHEKEYAIAIVFH